MKSSQSRLFAFGIALFCILLLLSSIVYSQQNKVTAASADMVQPASASAQGAVEPLQTYVDQAGEFTLALNGKWSISEETYFVNDLERKIDLGLTLTSLSGGSIYVSIWRDILQEPMETKATQWLALNEVDAPSIQYSEGRYGTVAWYTDAGENGRVATLVSAVQGCGDIVVRMEYMADDAGASLSHMYALVDGLDCAGLGVSPSALAASVPLQLAPNDFAEVRVAEGVQICDGYTDPKNNGYDCIIEGIEGNCTWWASYSRPDIPSKWRPSGNNGGQWNERAEETEGFSVSSTPSLGAIAVWEPWRVNGVLNVGHVAYVVSVQDNNRFTVSEMNWPTASNGYSHGASIREVNRNNQPSSISFIPATVTFFPKPDFGHYGGDRPFKTSLQFSIGDLPLASSPNSTYIPRSVFIPAGWNVTFYKGPNFTGASRYRKGGADLNQLEMSFWDLTKDYFSDGTSMAYAIRSVKIEFAGAGECTTSAGTAFAANAQCAPPTPIPTPLVPPPPPRPTPTPGPGPNLEIVSAPPFQIVAPGQKFIPQITVRPINGLQLLESRGDMLLFEDGANYSGFPHIGVVGSVSSGSNYTFRFYNDHPFTAPTTPGTYSSRWRVKVGGNSVGPQIVINFQVGEGSSGGNSAPSTPQLTQPGDWAEVRSVGAPLLCWNYSSDAEGDSIQYFAEIFESAVIGNSGWTSGNCWQPSVISGKYFGYQWRVRARDNRGAESGWSDIRHFTLSPPRVDAVQPTSTPQFTGHSYPTTEGAWWDVAWEYRQAVRLLAGNEPIGAGTFVKVTNLDVSALANMGRARADGTDVRVVYRIGTSQWREVSRTFYSPADIEFQIQDTIPAGGNAFYYLYYGNPSAGTPAAPSALPNGFWVDYYLDKWWESYHSTRSLSGAIDFGNVCSDPVDHDGRTGSSFDDSDQYRGRIFIPTSGTWTFQIYTNDGYDLRIDGVTVGQSSNYNGNQWFTLPPIYLNAGWHKLDARDTWVNCGAFKLSMSGPGFSGIVPSNWIQRMWGNVLVRAADSEVELKNPPPPTFTPTPTATQTPIGKLSTLADAYASDALLSAESSGGSEMLSSAAAAGGLTGVSSVDFYYYNGAQWDLVGSSATAPYEYLWEVPGALAEGEHYASVDIVDSEGVHTGILGSGYWDNFMLDRTAPSIWISDLLYNDATATITFSYVALDDRALANKVEYQVYSSTSCDENWQLAHDWSGAETAVLAVTKGATYCAYVSAKDDAGNTSASGVITFTVPDMVRDQTIRPISNTAMRIGDSPREIFVTASSGLNVVVWSQTPTVCSVASIDADDSGHVLVTPLSQGSCTIIAAQGGSWGYRPAELVTTITIVGGPTITPTFTPTSTSTTEIPVPQGTPVFLPITQQ